MSYIKADNPKEQKMFDYLEELRKSGNTNMYSSPPYLQYAFVISKSTAIAVVSKWMRLHSDPTRKLERAATKQEIHKLVMRFEKADA